MDPTADPTNTERMLRLYSTRIALQGPIYSASATKKQCGVLRLHQSPVPISQMESDLTGSTSVTSQQLDTPRGQVRLKRIDRKQLRGEFS